MPPPNGQHFSFRCANARDDGFRATLDQHTPDLAERPCEARDRDADDRAAGYHPTDHREASAGDDNLPRTATSELISVSPRGELRPHRRANTDELRAVGEPRQSDLRRGDAAPRVTVELLRLLDRLPALIERREVPALVVTEGFLL